jgi:uracil-DNA glycosylase family 4
VSTYPRPALSDLLAYLGEMGYGDLYLNPSRGAARSASVPVSASVAPPAAPAAPVASLVVPLAVDGEAAPRVAELAALAGVAAGCTRCRLAEGRTQVVFGSGNPGAELMFVGEVTGADEDRQGLPLAGAAGELLTKIIQAIERTREEVYIANVVKCRPPGDRDPKPDEIATCRGYLDRQIALVRPKVLVALGRVAALTLLGNDVGHDAPIGRMRGQWFQVQGIPTMVTYHPAALLRNPALKRPTWEDMQQVRDFLRGGISGSH